MDKRKAFCGICSIVSAWSFHACILHRDLELALGWVFVRMLDITKCLVSLTMKQLISMNLKGLRGTPQSPQKTVRKAV